MKKFITTLYCFILITAVSYAQTPSYVFVGEDENACESYSQEIKNAFDVNSSTRISAIINTAECSARVIDVVGLGDGIQQEERVECPVELWVVKNGERTILTTNQTVPEITLELLDDEGVQYLISSLYCDLSQEISNVLTDQVE